MKLRSSAFEHNQSIPPKYTCTGEDVNPPLEIQDTPRNTESLVLIVDDPDAPSKAWVHWVIFNIDPSTTSIEENSSPTPAVLGQNDFGKTGYGGPCPPSGTHRYFFKLYALDTKLDLDDTATKQNVGEAMKGHVLDQAELIGLYNKNR